VDDAFLVRFRDNGVNQNREGGVCVQRGLFYAGDRRLMVRTTVRLQYPAARAATGAEIRSRIPEEHPFGNHGAVARSFGTESLENGFIDGRRLRLGLCAAGGRLAAEEDLPGLAAVCSAYVDEASLACDSRRNDSG